MITPRFTVGSVTGYPIATTTSGGKPRTFWYVYDSAYNYARIAEYRGLNSEQRARQRAAELNAEPRAEPLDSLTTYLGYPIRATRHGLYVHEVMVGTFAAARRHIRELRRKARAA